MNGKPISSLEREQIQEYRKRGFSLPEIVLKTKRGYGTVWRLIKDVQVYPEYLQTLREKQGGSKRRAQLAWVKAKTEAGTLIKSLTSREKLVLMAGLYWGEGNKKNELNLINSDPDLIRVFISCLEDFGVPRSDFKISLRIFDSLSEEECIKYWSNHLDFPRDRVSIGEIIPAGKKLGKLKYGMCRVRVAKSAPYFKLLMSLIEVIKQNHNAAVVQRTEQGTPKP